MNNIVAKAGTQKRKYLWNDTSGHDVPRRRTSDSHVASEAAIMIQHLEFTKEVENPMKIGFKDGKVFPHPSAEGGNDTIGWGHKISNSEQSSGLFKKGILYHEAEELLKKDLASATRKAEVYFGNDWENMTPRNCCAAIDFAFNLGTVRIFPRLMEGLRENDRRVIMAEYKRFFTDPKSGLKTPLKHRNEMFYAMYVNGDVTEKFMKGHT